MADLVAPLPLTLVAAGSVVRFEAIDPTTGAAVAGVTISSASIYAATAGEDGDVGDLARLYLMARDD